MACGRRLRGCRAAGLAHSLPVYTLDGRERIEDPVIPPYAHPAIVASGEGN